ncbi:aldehyde dehydrogenase [Leucobacter luti]|uniref:aldehyde dehydrogenase family protein n=1 Tax=Leucobacter luti TaxID=340320 RepID=UPI00104A29B8|nr:aldehyde dehydrogenase family protein [Leucobacter luti]MCW2286962.1 aldehyde dehydrogenase (NAD+) [Leucobacter luti]QYM76860.1 aldehyde dehydrogenase family protein [Leucobacter luti]TCK41189.1 aldehyde dehydrogenase (NAD+) [Leucobacter luti]
MNDDGTQGNGRAQLRSFSSLIDGEVRVGDTSEPLLDPATGVQWGEVSWSEKLATEAIEAARRNFARRAWVDCTRSERADLFDAISRGVESRADELAELETLANGKPIAATRAEVLASARWWQYYAALIRGLRESHFRNSATKRTLLEHEPVGVVCLVTPFNGAFSLGTWKLAPALAAGNSVIIKPPVNSPGSSLILAEILADAGVPGDVVQIVQGGATVGRVLVEHPGVDMVSFTGSTEAAQRVGAAVSGRLAKFVAEAGGKSAHVIFEDADVEEAVTAVVQGVFSGTGQTCVAGSRVLVQRSIAAEFHAALIARVTQLRVGDPHDPATHLGPIATRQQLERIQGMLRQAKLDGAETLVGGTAPQNLASHLSGGYWLSPTVLRSAGATEDIWRQEVFGPVLTTIEFESEAEAIELANDSEFGLAAGFWTNDARRIERVSRRLQAGTVWVNCYRGMDWETPFGGVKQSGLGRENGVEGLREFQQVKSVVIDSGQAPDPFGIVPITPRALQEEKLK